MSASLAFQKFQRATLVANGAVTAFVPAEKVVDANARPEVFPRINIGEDQELPADDVVGRYTRLTSTLHIWSREPGLETAKAIAGAVRRALNLPSTFVFEVDGYRCTDCRFGSPRFIRDPDKLTAHGIVTIEALIEELA